MEKHAGNCVSSPVKERQIAGPWRSLERCRGPPTPRRSGSLWWQLGWYIWSCWHKIPGKTCNLAIYAFKLYNILIKPSKLWCHLQVQCIAQFLQVPIIDDLFSHLEVPQAYALGENTAQTDSDILAEQMLRSEPVSASRKPFASQANPILSLVRDPSAISGRKCPSIRFGWVKSWEW